MKDKIRLAVDFMKIEEHLDLIMKNCFETKDWRKKCAGKNRKVKEKASIKKEGF